MYGENNHFAITIFVFYLFGNVFNDSFETILFSWDTAKPLRNGQTSKVDSDK